MIEEGAYRRLIDAYYSQEKPLPASLKECYKLARAVSKPERDAVAYILRKYFVLVGDQYCQGRADEEIEAYKELEPERQAKRDNERERQRRSREDRRKIFDQLRERGITPAFDTKTGELRAMLSRVTSPPVTRDVTVTEQVHTCDDTATHTHPQSPVPDIKSSITRSRISEGMGSATTEGPGNVPHGTPDELTTWESHRQWVLETLRPIYPSNLHTDGDWETTARVIAGKLEAGEITREALLQLVTDFAKQQDAKGSRNSQYVENPVRHFDGRGKWRGPFNLPAVKTGGAVEDPDAVHAWDRLLASDGAERPAAAHSALTAVGGWMRVKERRAADTPFIRKQFIEAYANARRATA
jgi:uncharacterized protein YdaU (DUF1376 family)